MSDYDDANPTAHLTPAEAPINPWLAWLFSIAGVLALVGLIVLYLGNQEYDAAFGDSSNGIRLLSVGGAFFQLAIVAGLGGLIAGAITWRRPTI